MVLGWGFVNAKSRWSTTELSDSLMPGPQTPALLVTLGMVSLSETHAMLALLPMFPLQVNAQETCPSSSRMEEAADSRHSRMGQVLALGYGLYPWVLTQPQQNCRDFQPWDVASDGGIQRI